MTSFSRFAIATALLTLGACHAAPAHTGVGAAAWATAGSICRALGADLGIQAAKPLELSGYAYQQMERLAEVEA